MPLDPVSLAAGGLQTVVGLVNSGKAKEEAARLAKSRPKISASPYVRDQLSLAESDLSNGMSAEAENAYNQSTDRDLSTSIDAILKGGGSVNNIGEIFDNSQQGRQRLALIKENLRSNKINNLVNAQGNAENERQQMFQFNDWAPWSDAAKANAQARTNAQGQIWGGINTIGSSLINSLGKKNREQAQDDYLNPGSGYVSMRGSQPTAQTLPTYGQPNVRPMNFAAPTFNFPQNNNFVMDEFGG